MEIIKRKFHLLDINGQIRIGVMGVTSCLCILVFSMLTIYSFVLLNLCYVDVLDVIDKNENEGIEKVSFYIDSSLMVNSDISRTGMQWLNNLVKNFGRNTNLINFGEFIYISYFITEDNSTDYKLEHCKQNEYKCFFYYNLTNEFSDQKLNNVNFVQVLYHILPYLELLMKFKIMDQTSNPIHNRISIYSREYNSVFYYPYIAKPDQEINKKRFEAYNKVLLERYLFKYNQTLYLSDTNDYIKKYNQRISLDTTFAEILETTPIILNNFNIENLDLFANLLNVDQTVSLKFKENSLNAYNPNYDVNEIFSKVDYLVTGDWSTTMTEITQEKFYNQFDGIKAIYTSNVAGKETLYSLLMCSYFRILYGSNNPDVNLTEVFNPLNTNSTIYDCFAYPSAKTALDYLTQIPEWLSNNYKRKVKLPLMEDSNSEINYKIFKYHFPDVYGLLISNCDFMVFDDFNIYVFKNTRFVETLQKEIFFKFLGMMFAIILFNNVNWGLILFIIFILMQKVSKDITSPIQLLIHYVNNIGLTSDGNENSNQVKDIKNLDDIFYGDDKDINDMFKICKELIRGGFTIKSFYTDIENEKLNFLSTLNNLSNIKTNNLQIDEVVIEKDYIEHVKNFFNYAGDNVVMKNKIKKDVFFQFESNSENESESSFDEDGSLLNDCSSKNKSMMKRNAEDSSNLSDLDLKSKNGSMCNSVIIQKNINQSICNIPIKNSPDYNDKDFVLIAVDYSSKYGKYNFLHQNFISIELKLDNPFPPKYYTNTTNYHHL